MCLVQTALVAMNTYVQPVLLLGISVPEWISCSRARSQGHSLLHSLPVSEIWTMRSHA